MSCDQTQSSNSQQPHHQQVPTPQQYKAMMMPLVRFLKKAGLKFKHARVQNHAVEYFRVDQLNLLIQQNKKKIQSNKKLWSLIERLPEQVMYFRRLRNKPKLKYPQDLQPGYDSGKFAAFRFDITQSKKMMVMIIIIGIFLAVLFPLWPYTVKYYLWLASLYLLATLLIVISILGFSFWIFPNLFGDVGFIQSFKPFYCIQRWDSGVCSLICRLLALAFCSYYGYHIYLDPTFIFENATNIKVGFNDVHDWGVHKIKGQGANFSQRALTNLDTILNQTAQSNETMTESPISEQQQETNNMKDTEEINQKVQNEENNQQENKVQQNIDQKITQTDEVKSNQEQNSPRNEVFQEPKQIIFPQNSIPKEQIQSNQNPEKNSTQL